MKSGVRRKNLYFSHLPEPIRTTFFLSMMFPRSIPWVSWCAARALRKITLGRAVRAVLVPSLISTVAVMPPVLDVKKSKKKIPHQGLEPRTFALGGLYGTECNPNAIAIKLMRLFLHFGPKLLINSIDVLQDGSVPDTVLFCNEAFLGDYRSKGTGCIGFRNRFEAKKNETSQHKIFIQP